MVFTQILKLMAHKKMSYRALAKIIGCTYQAVSDKLNGRTEFKHSEMVKIREYFKDIDPTITYESLFDDIFLPECCKSATGETSQ